MAPAPTSDSPSGLEPRGPEVSRSTRTASRRPRATRLAARGTAHATHRRRELAWRLRRSSSREAPRTAARAADVARSAARDARARAGDAPNAPAAPIATRRASPRPRREPSARRRRTSTENPRLSKRMSELGLCSRREADEWIENGWVKVDGAVIEHARHARPAGRAHRDRPGRAPAPERAGDDPAQQADRLRVGPGRGRLPAGERADPPGESLGRGSARRSRSSPSHLRGLAPAGRLDIDSTGLIVFTQDGRVAQAPDRPRLRSREGIPGARRGHAVAGRHEAAPARPRARRREVEAGARVVAERASAALRAARRAASARSAGCASWSASRSPD